VLNRMQAELAEQGLRVLRQVCFSDEPSTGTFLRSLPFILSYNHDITDRFLLLRPDMAEVGLQ